MMLANACKSHARRKIASWQANREHRAASRRAHRRERAGHRLHEPTAYGQPESEPTGKAGAPAPILELHERLEDVVDAIGGNADPIVANVNDDVDSLES